ncbi:hypothetical protein BH23VER1_BH23VER1_34110 [soil metagenome]
MMADGDEPPEEDGLRSVALKNAQSILVARRRALDESRERSEWLQVTLGSIGDGVISTGADGRVMFMNPVAESLTGWAQADALGHPLADVFHLIDEETRQPVENPGPGNLDGADSPTLPRHLLLVAKDGTERPIHESVSPTHGEDGVGTGYVLVFRDVSPQRQVMRDLEASEARKGAMFEAAIDCIISIDHQGAITEFNPAAEQTFGYRREDVLGRELASIIIPPAYRERHRQGLARYLADGEDKILNRRLELPALRADGSEFPVELTVARIPVDGPPIFTAFLRDITERRRMETDLRDLAADLSEADRRKNEFLAMLAHELRNPLAPILNAVTMVKAATGGGGAVGSACAIMERQIRQMVRLVDELLDLSRISRGKIELRKERVRLADVIEQAVETSRPAVEAGGHLLDVKVPDDPIYLEADPLRLAQVFSNLLHNACKYSDPGTSISVFAHLQENEALVTVKDTGVGIPTDMLQKIFEMFTQVDSSLERAQGGLGIGLSLVKTLVELHGGFLSARSAGIGKGSEFVVGLPVLAGGFARTEVAADEPSPATTRRILVVDDNRDAATSLAFLLDLAGNETLTAFDGKQALDMATAHRPDAVLLDIGLPKMNGYEVAREIRSHPWGEKVLLVALTGWGQEKDRKSAKEAGFDGHMVKPVDLDALTRLLDKASLAQQQGE